MRTNVGSDVTDPQQIVAERLAALVLLARSRRTERRRRRRRVLRRDLKQPRVHVY